MELHHHVCKKYGAAFCQLLVVASSQIQDSVSAASVEMTNELFRWWTLGIGKTSMQPRSLQGSRQGSPERNSWKLQPCLKQAEHFGKALQEHEPT